MRKTLFTLAAVSVALTSCSQLGVPNGDVSGNINGTTPASKGTIRLALGSLTLSGVGNAAPDQLTLGTLNPDKKLYTISLPTAPKDGAYDIFAYADVNGNSRWDSGEPRAQSGGKGLVYSTNGLGQRDGSSLLNIKSGWTQMQNVTVVRSGRPFTNYDLSW